MKHISKPRPTTPRRVIRADIPRLEPDEAGLGGWFVVRGRFGWLFRSRAEAVQAARALAEQRR